MSAKSCLEGTLRNVFACDFTRIEPFTYENALVRSNIRGSQLINYVFPISFSVVLLTPNAPIARHTQLRYPHNLADL